MKRERKRKFLYEPKTLSNKINSQQRKIEREGRQKRDQPHQITLLNNSNCWQVYGS